MRMKPAQRRRATNVSLDPALLAEAQAMGLNLSRVLEERLKEVVQAEKQRRWLEENRGAFEAVNDFVAKHGVFNEDDREW
jgi:antitoxin CcdA